MKLDKNPYRGTAVSSFVWKLMERVFSQGISLFVQIILARMLMPEDFGALAIIAAITNYAAIFVQSGLSTAIIQKKDLKETDVSTVFVASMVIAAIMYTGIFVAAPFVAEAYGLIELKWTLRALGLILFLHSANAVQTALLSRKMKFKTLFFRSMFSVPLSGAVGIAMAYWGFGVWALVSHHLVSMLVIVVFMSLDKDARFGFGFSRDSFKRIYSFSWKVMLTSMIAGFHDALRTMIIGKKYSTEDLAYYDKAYTYSAYVTLIINTSISSVLLPVFSRQQDDINQLRSMARRAAKLSAFVMFPVLLGVAATATPLVRLLLTDKWAASIPFLMLFCVLRLPGCVMTADKQVYFALGKSGINLGYEIGLFIANLTALFITVPYGPMAIAIGATAVEIAGGITIWVISSKTYGYRVRDRLKDIARPMLNSVIMAGIVWFVGEQLPSIPIIKFLIQLPLGVVLYIVFSIVTRDESFRYCLNMIKDFIKRKSRTIDKEDI